MKLKLPSKLCGKSKIEVKAWGGKGLAFALLVTGITSHTFPPTKGRKKKL